ncbi:LacI family DNA-binding transcriptional regulator [Microbacterium sp. USHLN186]|uniref:LacI family DNA-binding transcriptional regulator n=1 Tax=Microbacterium sp. USHLN186 TaxID=3081286 RepID=UPI00301A3F88
MASIDEVARLAGVSTATVSRALSGRGQVSDAARERVRAAAAALGYVVSSRASSLASGRTRNVGVIVPLLDQWFFSTMLSGASSALMRAGYDITLYNITADADVRREVFDTFLRRQRVDAVIAVAIELDEHETGQLLDLGLPVIGVGGPNPRLRTLSVDDTAMARLATEHLIELGHREIAHIGAAGEFEADFRVPSRRLRGFEQALATASIAANPALLEPADFTVDGGHRAAARLLDARRPRPSAIFAASDEMAIGALLAARDLGIRVPEDLSIVGIDGHELGEFFQLTTVDQFPLAQGERAAAAVLAQLEGQADATAAAALPYELIVRSTTAPPRS